MATATLSREAIPLIRKLESIAALADDEKMALAQLPVTLRQLDRPKTSSESKTVHRSAASCSMASRVGTRSWSVVSGRYSRFTHRATYRMRRASISVLWTFVHAVLNSLRHDATVRSIT